MSCGIYTITSIIDIKIYVGYALDFSRRWAVHRYNLRNNKHQNSYLQAAWNKHGESNFKFEVLEECDKEFLCSQENYWCNLIGVRDSKIGYNLKGTSPHCRCKNSMETKLKMSKTRRQWIAKNPEYNPFFNMSIESKEKQLKGRKRRKVVQYNLIGEEIREYDSLSKVSEYGFNNISVQNCCIKRIKIYKGFVFRYKEDKFSLEKGKIRSKFQTI
jgi:group I intron endonuclease